MASSDPKRCASSVEVVVSGSERAQRGQPSFGLLVTAVTLFVNI
jgi:hypothetical protein